MKVREPPSKANEYRCKDCVIAKGVGVTVQETLGTKEIIMRFHKCSPKCQCQFIPPDVTENLAKAGIEAARLSFQQSQLFREHRSDKVVDIQTLIGAAPVKAAARQVQQIAGLRSTVTAVGKSLFIDALT